MLLLINKNKFFMMFLKTLDFFITLKLSKGLRFLLCMLGVGVATVSYAETANERSFKQIFSNNNSAFTNIPYQTGTPKSAKQKPNHNTNDKQQYVEHNKRHHREKRYYSNSAQNVVYVYDVPIQLNYEYKHHGFVIGQFLPSQYRLEKYRINNWAVRQLSQPLNGQYWVEIEDQPLLIDDDSYEILAVQ